MKKTNLMLCAAAFALAAPIATGTPETTATQPTPAAAPASSPNVDAEEAAVTRYLLKTAAACIDLMASTYDPADLSDKQGVDPTEKAYVQSIKVLMDMPLDDLPARHQPFVRESYELKKPCIEEMEKLMEQADAGTMDLDEVAKSLGELREKAEKIQRETEAKYPESAKLLGREAVQRLSQNYMPQLYQQISPRLQAHFKEHPEEAGDQKLIHRATFRIMAEILREMAL